MITPGEWKRDTNEQCPGNLKGCIIEADGVRIADVLARPIGSQQDCEDNARLIAAAPGLLAACKRALEHVEYTDGHDWPVAAMLRKAIAKAEGK